MDNCNLLIKIPICMLHGKLSNFGLEPTTFQLNKRARTSSEIVINIEAVTKDVGTQTSEDVISGLLDQLNELHKENDCLKQILCDQRMAVEEDDKAEVHKALQSVVSGPDHFEEISPSDPEDSDTLSDDSEDVAHTSLENVKEEIEMYQSEDPMEVAPGNIEEEIDGKKESGTNDLCGDVIVKHTETFMQEREPLFTPSDKDTESPSQQLCNNVRLGNFSCNISQSVMTKEMGRGPIRETKISNSIDDAKGDNITFPRVDTGQPSTSKGDYIAFPRVDTAQPSTSKGDNITFPRVDTAQPSTSTILRETGKRGRCGLCDWRVNRKGTSRCCKCKRYMCKDHVIVACPGCVCHFGNCLSVLGADTEKPTTPTTVQATGKRGRCLPCGWRMGRKGTNRCCKCRCFICKDHVITICSHCVGSNVS